MNHVDKTLTFVLSTGGCGTHLLIDLYKRAPVRFFDHRLVEFWVTYIQARYDPAAIARSDLFPGLGALDAVKGFYRRFGVDWGNDSLSESGAVALFGQMLNQAGPRLASIHNYELISPTPGPLADGRDPIWNLAMRDEARGLFERAVVAAGYCLDTLILLRHPVDVFLSVFERTGTHTPEVALYESTKAFIRLARDYARRPNTAMVRYEDLCRGDRGALDILARVSGLTETDLDASPFANGEIAKYRRYPRRRVAEVVRHLADTLPAFGYRAEIPSPLDNAVSVVVYSLHRWAGEIRGLNAVFAGDFRAPNAVFRRRRSVIGRIYWQISLLIPSRRRNYGRAYELVHSRAMPTPRYERPIRRLFGMSVVE